jgi:hypothetical protein
MTREEMPDFEIAFIVYRIEHGVLDDADPAGVAALRDAFTKTWETRCDEG